MKMKKITKLVLSLLMMLTCINLVNVHAEGNEDNANQTPEVETTDLNDNEDQQELTSSSEDGNNDNEYLNEDTSSEPSVTSEGQEAEIMTASNFNSKKSRKIKAKVVKSSDEITYGNDTFKVRYEDEKENDITLGTGATESFTFGEKVTINKATFAQPAGVIDGYVFEDAYFYWSGHYSGTKYNATEFYNFGKKVKDDYNSYLGFKCNNEDQDADTDDGYYAYNPTGVLHLVYKKVDIKNPYKIYFMNGVEQYAVQSSTYKWDSVSQSYKFYYKKTSKVNPTYSTPETGHTYTFKGWNTKADGTGTWESEIYKDGETEIHSDIYLYAIYDDAIKGGKAGYYLSLDSAKWLNDTIPQDLERESETSQKYYYNYGFSKGDTFEVVDSIPTAEGYQFIGWLDKERESGHTKKEANIVNAGDEVTYIYEGDDKYTLDALWASIAVTNYSGTYDGQEHTISDESVAINEGTQLDDKYKQQALSLITVKENTLMYSTDSGEDKTWSINKPTFTDAGTYTVYVKETVILGGQEKELVGQGTVTINQAPVTVTIPGDSKTYDGTPLVATGSINGLVTGETATLNIINGSITDAGSIKPTYNITWAPIANDDNDVAVASDIGEETTTPTAKESNYSVTEAIGNLTITPISTSVIVKVSGNTVTAEYDGQPHTVSGYTFETNNNLYTGSCFEYDGSTEKTMADVNPNGGGYVQGLLNENFKNVSNNFTNVTIYVEHDGRLYITPKKLIVTTESDSKTYDGTPLTKSGTITGFVTGETYGFNTTGTITDVLRDTTGTVVGKPNTYALKFAEEDSQYTAKKTNYVIDKEKTSIGTLTINPKEVTVSAKSLSKVYGESDPEFTASVTGKVNEGDVINYTISRTEGENAGNYDILPTGEESQGNYKVVYENGTLTVTAKSITPETPEGDKTGIEVSTLDDVKYNGASQQQKPEINDTKTGKTLVEGTDYEVTYSEDTTNAGQVTVTIKGIGNYTGEYTVTYNILKRDVTFTSPSASKTYDGSALTSTEIAISGEGFVEGEGASFNVTGTATEVGEVDNTFDYAMNEGTNADNYNVTVVNGKLTITAAPVVPSNDDATPTNNNTTPVTPVTPTRRTTPNRNTTPVAPETDSTPTATPEATVEPTETPEATATPEVIDDDETPEVAPKGNWALINLIAAMLSVLLGVIAILAKHKDEDEDEEDETEDENVSTRHRRWKIVSAIDAIVAVVAFILTEDITQKMVMVDKWTILMVVIAVVGVVSMYFARKWHEEDEETSEDA